MHREDAPADHVKRLGHAAESGDTTLVAELLATPSARLPLLRRAGALV
ncbi:hypothetical protein [Streptomyces sp. NPDC056056]